jgi:hypothetical protein
MPRENNAKTLHAQIGTLHDFKRKEASQNLANPLEALVPEEGFKPSEARGLGDFESKT